MMIFDHKNFVYVGTMYIVQDYDARVLAVKYLDNNVSKKKMFLEKVALLHLYYYIIMLL